QEALAMARLDHPNIPRLYTFGEDNGSYYLVMEFVSGSPLSEEIHEKGPIPSGRAVPIMGQVLEAVSYAHKNGVIHRDLKPDNIILVEGGPGLVKVLDFGIAKMVGGENLTLTGEGFGTPSYMSPERIVGKSELDARTDVYSLGIILFEMVAGHVPFQSKSTDPALYWVEMRRKHETEPIPDLGAFGVPPELEAIIRKATAKRLDERYRTAEEMLSAIRGENASACLLITSNPGGAEVLVDNVSRGTTGTEKCRLMIEGLAPGLHGVRVAKQGYAPYKIDVSLALGPPTELQVQLSAHATTAIPRLEITEPVDPNTDKIHSGDDAKTAMLMIESLAPGSLVSFEGERAVAGADGRAVVPIGEGTHEIQVLSPSGIASRQVVTVGNQELGLLKTIAITPGASTDPGQPQPATRTAAQIGQPPAPTYSPVPAYPPPATYPPAAYPGAATGAPVAPGYQVQRSAGAKSSMSKKVAGAVSAVILLGLTGLAYYVVRGPGRGQAAGQPNSNQQQQVSANLPLVPPATPVPTEQPTPVSTPTPVVSQENANRSQDNKNSARKDKADPLKPPEIMLAQETPKPEHMRPVTTPTPPPVPIQVPTPRPTPYSVPRQDDQGSNFEGDACVMVSVIGPSGEAVSGVRVVCVDEQAGLSGVRRGMTNNLGRWRNCGVTAGHRVLIRVVGPAGRILGARQVQVSRGQNSVSVQVASDPTRNSVFRDRERQSWQRP
ncbi:MAG: protein kinase domain-containing protein, partial [Blastocatellia bacterium]